MDNTKNTSPEPTKATPEPVEPMKPPEVAETPEPTLVPREMMERARKPRQVVLRDPDGVGEDEVVPLNALLVEALAVGPPTLSAPLLAALTNGQYFIAITWRCKPQPPDDLLHHWEHRGLAETDVIPALQFQARHFASQKILHLQRQSGERRGWS